MNKLILIALLGVASTAYGQSAESLDNLNVNNPEPRGLVALSFGGTGSTAPTPTDVERCEKELKKAKRKVVWAQIALGAVSGVGNTLASQRTATFKYNINGQRSVSSVQYTDYYNKARLDARDREMQKGLPDNIVEEHMTKTGCWSAEEGA